MASPNLLATVRPPFWKRCVLLALLLFAYFLVRLPHLRDLPVFCDEATYMRWAQLVYSDPVHNLFVSMEDAKPPLHYWLLALFYPFFSDPIYAGRFLSVLLGAATIPLLFGLAEELTRLPSHRAPSAGSNPFLTGAVLTLFMITSPLLAMYQRMTLAEPLLLLESVALAWASLRFARNIATQEVPGRNRIYAALFLGVLWGAALLTKQNFSYLFWMLPLVSIALYCRDGEWRKTLRTFAPLYIMASCIGLLLFIPVLFTSSALPFSVRLFYKPAFYSSAALPRATSFLWNLISLVSPRVNNHAQWWPYNPAAPLDDGLLYLYLTPPVFFLLLAGSIYLLWKRRLVSMVFLGTWCAALLGVLAANTNAIRTRYALLGVAPLILLAAWITAEFLATLPLRRPALRMAAQGIVLLALLAWPVAATTAQLCDYTAPTLLAMDRSEYLSACSAGSAAQQAIGWLAGESARGPITLITNTGFGLQNDLSWLELRNQRSIQLVCTDQQPLSLMPPPQLLTLGIEQWYPARTASILLSPSRPIYEIVPMSRDSRNQLTCAPALSTYARAARIVALFENPPPVPNAPTISALAVIRIDPPMQYAQP